MPRIPRERMREIVEHFERETNVTPKQVKSVLRRRGMLHGTRPHGETGHFGRDITPREQKEYFDKLAEQMKLTPSQRQKWERMVRGGASGIQGTLRHLEGHNREEEAAREQESSPEEEEAA